MANGGDDYDYIEYDNNTKNKIKLKLQDIQKPPDLANIDCKFLEQKINFQSIGFTEAKERLDIYENISKLSVYLLNDYEFFTQCTIRSVFKCPRYNDAMENLGFQRKGSYWTSNWRPKEDIVIDNIFRYCLYSYIVKKKNQISNQPNAYRPFSTKSDSHNYDQKGTQHYIKNEHLENQREQPHYRKQEKSHYYGENNMKYKQKNEDTRHNTNRQNNQFENLQIAPKYNDNHNYEQRKSNFQNEEKLPKKNKVFDKWKCKVCEMLNSYEHQCCEACDLKRPGLEKWSCSKCTYFNEPDSVNCLVCGWKN